MYAVHLMLSLSKQARMYAVHLMLMSKLIIVCEQCH